MKRTTQPILALLGTLAPCAWGQATPDLTLLPPAGGQGQFGRDVHVDGDRIIVSYAGGKAWIYELQADGSALEVAELCPPPGAETHGFAWSVSLSGDRAIVGSQEDDGAEEDAGAAYVYERQTDGTWPLTATLFPSDVVVDMEFGVDVDIDGDRVVVGEQLGTVFEWPLFTGAAYVFERNPDATWTEVAKLEASDPPEFINALFGFSVALDGDRVIVGARHDGNDVTGELRQGAAYVYERQPGGGWAEVAKSEAFPEADTNNYGYDVAIDGDRAIVGGAPFEGVVGAPPGFARILERTPGGSWLPVATIEAPLPQSPDWFGQSVAIEGERAVVGAGVLQEAHVFRRQFDGAWTHEVTLSGPSDGSLGWQGMALEGGRAVIADPTNSAAAQFAGAVFVLETGTLYHGSNTVSLSSGGTQTFHLRAGTAFGSELFVMLGSASGTSPGVPLGGGVLLPLQIDAYFNVLVSFAGAGLVGPFVGVLDAEGESTSGLFLPAGTDPALVGTVLNHAYLVLDSPTLGVEHASNPVDVEFVP